MSKTRGGQNVRRGNVDRGDVGFPVRYAVEMGGRLRRELMARILGFRPPPIHPALGLDRPHFSQLSIYRCLNAHKLALVAGLPTAER